MKDVHTEHCCKDHGCKYGDKDCPVVIGTAIQAHPCELCHTEETARINTKLKKNIIKLMLDHKEHCSSPDCGISTYLVMVLTKQAGITLTAKEQALFL